MSASMQQPGDRLAGMNFAEHNAEQHEAWKALRAGNPYRIPIILGTNSRYFMFDPEVNPDRVEYRAYSEDPDVMFDCRLKFERYSRFNLLQDLRLGPPAQWEIAPDFQNVYEAAWFGCPIEYIDGQVPDTRPAFADCPERIMENGSPDSFGGFFARVKSIYEHFKARAEKETYFDLPIKVVCPYTATGTDGPMTVACNVFGPEFVCEAMVAEPERLETLLAFINEATIRRVLAWRQYGGIPEPDNNWGFADDSIALISTEMYRTHILPHHRKLCDALGGKGKRSVHLCGDSTRHFVTMRDELNIHTFDTGFPIDFAKMRTDLGLDVQIQGGPHVEFLLTASPDAVRQEVRKILGSGLLEGGRVLLREGNNLAPGTPRANTEAMYRAGREFGRIRLN